MRKSNDLTIWGYREGDKVRGNNFNEINKAKAYVDGYKLDDIFISVHIYNPDDIDDLIKLLEIARHSLHTQGKYHDNNE